MKVLNLLRNSLRKISQTIDMCTSQHGSILPIPCRNMIAQGTTKQRLGILIQHNLQCTQLVSLSFRFIRNRSVSSVHAIDQGHNVFYTGSAGTGKPTVLKAYVSRLKSANTRVDIIAPTGIAALNVGGQTLYRYAGWHPDIFKENQTEFLKRPHGKKIWKRLSKTDVLVVDGIFMIEETYLCALIVSCVQHAMAVWESFQRIRTTPENPNYSKGTTRISTLMACKSLSLGTSTSFRPSNLFNIAFIAAATSYVEKAGTMAVTLNANAVPRSIATLLNGHFEAKLGKIAISPPLS